MSSYFEIYDDQENKTVYHPRKAQIKKQTRSVLGEISLNTQKRQKRITKSDEYQGSSRVFNLQTFTKKTHHTDVTFHNRENTFIYPTAKTSQAVQESLQSLSPTLISDNTADELNRRVPDNSSVFQDDSAIFRDDSMHSSVFQDDSIHSSPFRDDRMDQVSLYSNDTIDSSVFQDESVAQVSLPSSGFRDVSLRPFEEKITEDIISVPEYSREIYKYLKDSELRCMPKWNYMERQVDITFSMRAILVDWLVEVAGEYKLKTETAYLAVSYTDRFLSKMSVVRSKLQLVGTACLFIASKYEEIYPPGVGEFVFITNDSYTKKQVLRMEQLVLKVLGFDLSMPTSYEFVNQNCLMFDMDDKALHLALYLNELSLLDGRSFLKFPPSVLAASSVVLARHNLGLTAWTDDMAASAGYSLEDLKECVVILYEAFTAAETSSQQTVREKYKQNKFSNVAEVSPVDIM